MKATVGLEQVVVAAVVGDSGARKGYVGFCMVIISLVTSIQSFI